MRRNVYFGLFALTLMWLVTIPGLLYFFHRVVGMPWDLTCLLLLPSNALWVPLSYPLTIASYERYARLGEVNLSAGLLMKFGALGVLAGFFSVASLWLYVIHAADQLWAWFRSVLAPRLACWRSGGLHGVPSRRLRQRRMWASSLEKWKRRAFARRTVE